MNEPHQTARLLGREQLHVAPRSVVEAGGVEYGLAHVNGYAQLAVLAGNVADVGGLEGNSSAHADGTLLLGPCNAVNIAALRERLAWLRPGPLGLRTSAGLGDRLGLATPGHVWAMRAAGGNIAPIFAQQSIREMQRTGRSAQEVMDDATWGVFAEGWRDGSGADADHLKTFGDIDICVAAGYTFFTVDPGEHVDDRAESVTGEALRDAFEALPWKDLEDSPEDAVRRYGGLRLTIEEHVVGFDETTALRAAVKYGRAVAHVARMYRHLMKVGNPSQVELEVSVDETAYPTSHAEHVYLAAELQRLGVRWVSLAPRYVGQFEKGVDYIGDLDTFEADFAVHAAIARHYGPYKLSLHSGSDKFSVYGIAARQTRGLVHLKTAGTSYLEALRTIAALDSELFREIYQFAREHYEADRASYHVSARLERAPLPGDVPDGALSDLLTQFDAREILHVTFGSVLKARRGEQARFYDRLMAMLRAHPDAYARNLETHFVRHLEPFVLPHGQRIDSTEKGK
ncbi:MAG: tagaturonate epimerase family protein [Herpetosiphon sp.]